MSLLKKSRISLIPNLSMAIRSTPIPKAKPLTSFGIIINKSEHRRVGHAGPQNLQPSRAGTDPAPFPPANEALNIHLGARLGEREETGPEPEPCLLSEHLMDKDREHPFQIRKGDSLVHQKSFDLVKHGRVGRIRIPPVNGARRNNPDGRALLLHRPHLHRRGVGPQNDFVRNEEGGLHLPRRVSLRDIEGLEIVVVQFHLRPFDHLEADPGKNGHHLVQGLGDRMFSAGRKPPAGKGHIDPLPLQGLLLLPLPDLEENLSIFASSSSLI